jgi:hypothetical protein
MPIRLRHRDNEHQDAQLSGSEGILVVVLAIETAGYMGWKAVFGILGGSI